MKRPVIYILLIFFGCTLWCQDIKSRADLTAAEQSIDQVDGQERVELLIKLAAGYRRQQPQKALHYASLALDLLKNHPDKKSEIMALVHASFAANILGDTQLADNTAQKSLKLARTTGFLL